MVTGETPDHPSGHAEESGKAIDVERLADRVYRLMLAELRLEQSRGAGMDHSQTK